MALLGPKLPPRLRELGFDLRPREISAYGGVRDAVVACELPQRLAGRAAADQPRVGNQPTQPTGSLHTGDSSSRLAHHERTTVAKSDQILFRPRLPRKPSFLHKRTPAAGTLSIVSA
jgi:hypothetical protein